MLSGESPVSSSALCSRRPQPLPAQSQQGKPGAGAAARDGSPATIGSTTNIIIINIINLNCTGQASTPSRPPTRRSVPKPGRLLRGSCPRIPRSQQLARPPWTAGAVKSAAARAEAGRI
eukprot:scaffold3791_cov390-Prasinococcus_capsulatus_cf.AAC.15